jgi:hypothetical protein
VTKVEQFEAIRRDRAVDGKSVREIARERGVHRRKVRQAISSATPLSLPIIDSAGFSGPGERGAGLRKEDLRRREWLLWGERCCFATRWRTGGGILGAGSGGRQPAEIAVHIRSDGQKRPLMPTRDRVYAARRR